MCRIREGVKCRQFWKGELHDFVKTIWQRQLTIKHRLMIVIQWHLRLELMTLCGPWSQQLGSLILLGRGGGGATSQGSMDIKHASNTKVVHMNRLQHQNVPSNTKTNVRDQLWDPSTVDHTYIPPSTAVAPWRYLHRHHQLDFKLQPRKGMCSSLNLGMFLRLPPTLYIIIHSPPCVCHNSL